MAVSDIHDDSALCGTAIIPNLSLGAGERISVNCKEMRGEIYRAGVCCENCGRFNRKAV